MFDHMVSPPAGGMTMALSTEQMGGESSNVQSVCHTSAT